MLKRFLLRSSLLLLACSRLVGSEYQWSSPTYFASATCSEFKWVDDLDLTEDTVKMMEKGFFSLGGSKNHYLTWKNGTAADFLDWMDRIPSDTHATLIFYFSTHQKPKGRIKFSSGPDLEAVPFIEKINLTAQKFKHLILVHDCCRAAELENYGSLSENVIRLYSASEGEEAIDVDFEKGAYGVSEFIQQENAWIESLFKFKLRGLTFLTTLGLKSAYRFSKEPSPEINLSSLIKQMNSARAQYDEDVRHGKIQHFKLIPENADIVLLKKLN